MGINRIIKRVCRFFVAVLVVAIPLKGYAALQHLEPELSWKNVSVDNKKVTVYCVFCDSRGIMWLGTNDGLYFYDGVMTHPVGEAALFGAQIYSIVEKDDRLYIGSNNGLVTYAYESGIVSKCVDVTPNEIRALLLVDDDLWIGGLNGICKYNIKNKSLIDFTQGLPHKSVYSLLRDSRGILYVGTYNGVARWDSNRKSFKPLKIRVSTTDKHSLFANCMLETDDNESIYIGGDGSLYRYYPTNEKWVKINAVEGNNIKSLAKGDNGHMLVGTEDGLFDLFGNSIRYYRHDSRKELSLADNEIWCICADAQHNIWVGHNRGFSIASNSTSIRTIKLGELALSGEGNEIYNIFRDSKDNLWFGGSNGVIRLSQNAIPHWYRHSELQHSLSNNRIRSILEDANKNIWFATDGGINKYNEAHDHFDVFHAVDKNGEHNTNWVYALVEDDDHFWVGSFLNGLHYVAKHQFKNEGGIVVADLSINTDTQNANGLKLANNLISNVIKDKHGNLWILLFRDKTLTRYNLATKKMTPYNVYALTGGYPTHICLDKDGRIWCAYKGGVIVFEDNGYKIIKFPYTNSDETIIAMGKVGADVWVSTHSNVWSIDGKTLQAELLPIPQKSYSAIYEDTIAHKVFLGGTDEILEVDNSIIDSNIDYKTIKMVLISDRDGKLNLNDLKGGENGITIPYGGNVTLVVSTLNYSPETVQRFMYKLAESPSDTTSNGWIIMPEGVNTITLTNLNMGKYCLLVKTVDSPSKPVTIPLDVNPPLFLSWWSIIIYIMIIIGIVYLIVWYTRKKNLRKFQEQERQAALENVERKLTFLSTISHDLKTPLSMILGPVSLMKERAKDPENRKSLETVYDNAVRLNNMIHRTLEIQQLDDSDESLLILSTFDVVDFCKGIFEIFKENNPLKNFVFHSSCTQILIEADAVKFESIITNLLSNACKYSDDGATISLGISKQENHVELVVSDDGVGIADKDQALVFQRMFRAPATSKLKEGTGLGLYLIKRYLELLGGNINLYSKEGQGSSFVITLPISDKIITENHKDGHSDHSNKPKILIVEDNLQISAFIKEILEDRFTYLSAENGRSGLAIAASFAPNLIIVDEMMPIMSGLEMVKRMKQTPRLASIPTIMLTAKNDNTTENESIKLGIDVFMAKPFEPAFLLGRINNLLKARSEMKEQVRIQTITEAESKPIEAESVNEKYLAQIARIIEDNISDPDLNVNLLCEKSGIPNKQLYRLIKKYMGVAPLDYIRRVRLQKAAVLLAQKRFTVSEISYMVGFKTPSYFAKCFQNQFGVKPSQYQSEDETLGNK